MIQRNLYDEISKAIYGVISYGKCGMNFKIIKLLKEKSYRVSPHVASNSFKPTSHKTCHIQLIGSCVTGLMNSISEKDKLLIIFILIEQNNKKDNSSKRHFNENFTFFSNILNNHTFFSIVKMTSWSFPFLQTGLSSRGGGGPAHAW